MPRRKRSESDEEPQSAKRTRLDLSYADEEDRIELAPQSVKRKRRNPQLYEPEDEDRSIQEDEDEITPVYANGNRGSSRRRASAPSDDDQHGADFDYEDDEITVAQDREHTGATADPSDEEDEQGDEGEEDDEETVQEQIRLSTEKGFAHSGILHSVRLDRFMSHTCFQYDLGPNMNIINGKNGSGKSAIVAALQLGLNGKVGITERAKRLDELIKHGEESAIITVKILNRKPPQTENGVVEADLTYKHDIYGDIITIERRILRGGGKSTFAVKARNKHVKLDGITPRDEVQNICDHFGIMVENPVAVLTQTRSKEFLAKGKPENHYKLFHRATLLEPLEHQLTVTKNVTREVEILLKSNLERAPEAEEQLRKKEQAHQQAQEMNNIHEIIRHAEASFAWTVVQEEELKLHKFERKTAEEFEPAVEQARLAHDKSQQELEAFSKEQAEQHRKVTEATEKSRILAGTCRHSNKNAQTVKFDLERQRRRVQEFEADCKRHQQDIQNAKARMERAREKHFAGQEQKARILREIQEIEGSVGDLEARTTSARSRESTLLSDKLPLEDEIQRMHSDSNSMRLELEGKRRQHMQADVMARNNDNLARFGNGMSDICDRIRRNEHRFHKVPIGPIGQFVSIHDDSWAAAVETAIGFNSLKTFIVSDSHDAKLLESLLPRGGQRPTITIANMNRDRYRVTREDLPDVSGRGHRTILETIDIEHNAVFNLLLDQSHIERQVLSADEEDVTQLGWSRIPNLKMVWNRRCDRAYSRNGSNVFRNGYRPHARILTKDMRPYLRSLEDDIRNISREAQNLKDKLQQADKRMRSINASVRDERREIEECGRKISDLNRKKASLEDQLNQAENAFDSTPFEQEISGYEAQVSESQGSRARALSEVGHLENKLTQASEAAKEAAAAMREANDTTKQATRRLEVVHDRIARVRSSDRQNQTVHERAREKVRKAHQEIEAQRNRVTDVMVQARELGDCPENVDPTAKTSADWQRYLTTQKQRLETEQERRGGRTAAEIEMDYLLSKKQHDQNVQFRKRVKYYVKMLNRGINYREQLIRRLKSSLKKMVKANFRRFLGTRGHTGSVVFGKSPNGVSTLRLCTEMATHQRGDGERHRTEDLRTLSGGEKSYTTLCFILALAEICQTPIRVMDEIDVFQDEASRHASFTTITQFCTRYLSNRQIIIITPLALPNFTSNDAVRVVRLPDPVRQEERGRQTLIDNYMAATED